MKALGWLYWAAYQIVSLVLIAIGTFLVLPAALGERWHTRPSKNSFFAPRPVTAWDWRILCPWDNEQDGVAGASWYRAKYRYRKAWLNAYIWSVFRNGSNNMRRLPGAMFEVTATPDRWRSCKVFRAFGHVWRIGWLIAAPPFEPGVTYLAWPVAERLS